MSFEPNPSKVPVLEVEPDINHLIEEEKKKIRTQFPERFELFEKFLSFDKKTLLLLPFDVRQRYGELEEDWFNISDTCDRMGGEEKYRKIIVDIEEALADRERKTNALKGKMAEIGMNRLSSYFDMKLSESQTTGGATDSYDFHTMRSLVSSQDSEIFGRQSFERIDRMLCEVGKINVAVVDQWVKQQEITARQAETRRLKAEKVRILKWLQRLYGREWKVIVELCQKLKLVKEVPKNGEMLNGLYVQELMVLEKRFRDVENKLREYDMYLLDSTDEDVTVVIDEVLHSVSDRL